jgi:hypothetical protein
MTNLIIGIIILAWGIWCIVAAILNKKIQFMASSDDEFLPKKILGKYYDTVMNIVLGCICISFGYFIITN